LLELPRLDGLPEQLAVGFELPGHGAHRVVAKAGVENRGRLRARHRGRHAGRAASFAR